MTRDDLVYRLDGRFTHIVPYGLVADGLRLDGHFAGPISVGDYAGADVTGVDYFRIRRDGVGVVDAHEVMTFGGATVAVKVDGYVLPPADVVLPSLEDMASPGFTWPDLDLAVEAFARFTTAAPELAELNRTVVGHTGTVNFATGTVVIEARRLDAGRRSRRPEPVA